jgi:hypothetical protein
MALNKNGSMRLPVNGFVKGNSLKRRAKIQLVLLWLATSGNFFGCHACNRQFFKPVNGGLFLTEKADLASCLKAVHSMLGVKALAEKAVRENVSNPNREPFLRDFIQ